jgi:hypothetical protein
MDYLYLLLELKNILINAVDLLDHFVELNLGFFSLKFYFFKLTVQLLNFFGDLIKLLLHLIFCSLCLRKINFTIFPSRN